MGYLANQKAKTTKPSWKRTSLIRDRHMTISEQVPTLVHEPAKQVLATQTKTIHTLDASKPIKFRKSTRAKIHIEEGIFESIASLPFEEGYFRTIPCDRKKATYIQQRLYSINKDNVAGWVYATRYNTIQSHLLVWRMA